MGLDMYLNARIYLSEYSSEAQKKAFEKLQKLTLPGVTMPKVYLAGAVKSFQIEVPVMYWRKANHIHSWFVTEVQSGEDDCKDYYVGIEQLRELDKLCAEVVMSGSKAVAADKLPAADGFFFGGSDYDEWYFQHTRETMGALHQLLADHDSGKLAGWDFHYSSSW